MKPRTLAIAVALTMNAGASIAQTPGTSTATPGTTPATPGTATTTATPTAQTTIGTTAPNGTTSSSGMTITSRTGTGPGSVTNTTVSPATGSISSTTTTPSVSGSATVAATPGSNVILNVPGQNAVGSSSSIGANVTTVTTDTVTFGPPPPVDAAPSSEDQALLDAVVNALAADPALRGASLQVAVSAGVVSITGMAQDSSQAEHARNVAASLAGHFRVNTAIGTR
jgi:large repetitive protein